eukprot:7388614-Prymnesium_polylepis.1
MSTASDVDGPRDRHLALTARSVCVLPVAAAQRLYLALLALLRPSQVWCGAGSAVRGGCGWCRT